MPVWSIIATSSSWANPLVLDLLVARAQKIELLPGVGLLHVPSPPQASPSKYSNVWGGNHAVVRALQPVSRMAELRAKNGLTAASRSDYTLHGCRRGFVGALYFLA
jgi:hypothetical protein